MKSFLSIVAVLHLTGLSVYAVPPFNPQAALDWCIETVVSPVPAAKRIYVLGPDKTKETYILNGRPASHDLETRQAVEYSDGLILSGLFQSLPKYTGDFSVSVWRVPLPTDPAPTVERPLFTAQISQASVSSIALRPNDIVVISRPVSGFF